MRRDLLCMAALAFIIGLFFFPLVQGKTFSTVAGFQNAVFPWAATPNNLPFVPQSDQAELSYPWYVFMRNSLANGELPLWNPNSFFGQPFLSNGSSGVLYPPRLLIASLRLPPSVAHDILCIIHMLGAGIFMFLFMRALRCGRIAAMLSATAWMLGSYNSAWLHLEVVAPIFVLLPLGCYCVLRATTFADWPSRLIAWGVLATILVSGHLPYMGITFLTVAVYGAILGIQALHRAWECNRPITAKILDIGLFFVLPPLLAGLVLLPTFRSILHSARTVIPYQADHLATRVQPAVFLRSFWPPDLPLTEIHMHEMAFVGVLVALLAIIGLLRHRPGMLFFGLLAIIVLLLATDTYLLRVAFALFPWFGIFRPLGRLLFLWSFAIAGLGGLGLDNLMEYVQTRMQKANLSGQLRKPLLATVIAISIWLFTTIELASYGRHINPTFHPRRDSFLFPSTSLIRKLQQEIGQNTRIIPLSSTTADGGWLPPMLHGATSMVWSIPSAGGYDSVVPQRTLHFLEVLCGRSPEDVIRSPHTGTLAATFLSKDLRYDLLPRFGITHLVATPQLSLDASWRAKGADRLHLKAIYSAPDGIIWQISDTHAGPHIIFHATIVDSPGSALSAIANSSFDSTTSVILERSDVSEILAQTFASKESSLAIVRRHTNNEIIVDARSAAAGWLVLQESWDPGWTAYVNGRSERILHANYAFRAVRIPAGESRIEFRYRPDGWQWGLFISIAACIASLGLAYFLDIAQRKSPSTQLAG